MINEDPLSQAEIKKPVDESLQDQRGGKSSKRVWAAKWGWISIIQTFVFIGISVGFAMVGKDMPPILAEILKYTLAMSIGANLLLLGLTLPEWFASRKDK